MDISVYLQHKSLGPVILPITGLFYFIGLYQGIYTSCLMTRITY